MPTSDSEATHSYEPPRLTEYGDIRELTAASNNFGNEDGGVKHDPGQFGGDGFS